MNIAYFIPFAKCMLCSSEIRYRRYNESLAPNWTRYWPSYLVVCCFERDEGSGVSLCLPRLALNV